MRNIKGTLQNFNKVNGKLLRWNFWGKIRSIKLCDYSNHISVDDAYQDFAPKFLSVVDSVKPIRTLKVKSKTKPLFDIDILHAICKHDKYYK